MVKNRKQKEEPIATLELGITFAFTVEKWLRIWRACDRNGAKDVASAIKERIDGKQPHENVTMCIKVSTCRKIIAACGLCNESMGHPFVVAMSKLEYPVVKNDSSVDAETMETVRKETGTEQA